MDSWDSSLVPNTLAVLGIYQSWRYRRLHSCQWLWRIWHLSFQRSLKSFQIINSLQSPHFPQMQPALKQKMTFSNNHRTSQNIQHCEGVKEEKDQHHCQQACLLFTPWWVLAFELEAKSPCCSTLCTAQHVRPNHKMAGEFFHPGLSLGFQNPSLQNLGLCNLFVYF